MQEQEKKGAESQLCVELKELEKVAPGFSSRTTDEIHLISSLSSCLEAAFKVCTLYLKCTDAQAQGQVNTYTHTDKDTHVHTHKQSNIGIYCVE